MNLNIDQKHNKDPDLEFRKIYNIKEIKLEYFINILNNCHLICENINNFPNKRNLLNYEILNQCYFNNNTTNNNNDNDLQQYYEVSIYICEFISLFCTCIYSQQNISSFEDLIFQNLEKNFNNNNNLKYFELSSILCCSFGLYFNNENYLNKYFNFKTFSYLINYFLVQNKILQSKSYQIILELFGELFIFYSLNTQNKRIIKFIEEIQENFNNNLKILENFNELNLINFIKLIIFISKIHLNYNFSLLFYETGKEILHFCMEYICPKFFNLSIELFSSLCKNEELSELIFERFNNSISDIFNLEHFLIIIQDYSNELNKCEIDYQRINFEECEGLEFILELISKLFFYNNKILIKICNNSKFNLINNLFQLILSQIPISLKSKCFDLLTSICKNNYFIEEIFKILENSQILTNEQLKNNKGGIINDINEIENNQQTYLLLRSFIRFLSFLIFNHNKEFEINKYHQFLFENCLLKLSNLIYFNLEEKWLILCELSQFWNNLCNYSINYNIEFLRCVFCDQRFFQSFLLFINENNCPIETLFCIFRMFLSLIEQENNFELHMNSIDHSSFLSLIKQISWSSLILKKIILCIGENDKDLQFVSIQLALKLILISPNIVEINFSNLETYSIKNIIKCLILDEKEDNNNEINIRNSLLCFLNSLNNSSYFLRFICGYDLSNIPNSLIKSNLDKGILIKLIEKIINSESVKNYPIFSSLSFQLILKLCNNIYTITPLLNLIRSSSLNILERLLEQLTNLNSSKRSIGLFLQLIGIESSESSFKQTSSTTLHLFKLLFGFDNYLNKEHRIIQIFEFIDRINNEEESIEISKGLFESIISFLNNLNILEFIKNNINEYKLIFKELIINLIKKCLNIEIFEITKNLSNIIGFLSTIIYNNKIFKFLNINESIILLSLNLNLLKHFYEFQHNNSRLGIYLFLSNLINYHFKEINNNNNNNNFNNLINNYKNFLEILLIIDLNSEIIINKISLFSFIESLILINNFNFLNYFIEQNIYQLSNDWIIYEENYEQGSYLLEFKLSMFLKYNLNNLNKNFLINNNIIQSLSYNNYWNNLSKIYSTCNYKEISELQLNISLKILQIFNIIIIFNKFNKEEFYNFYLNYYNSIYSILDFSGLITIKCLKFLKELINFLNNLKEYFQKNNFQELFNKLKSLNNRFKSPEKYEDLFIKKFNSKNKNFSNKDFNKINKIIKEILILLEKIY